MHVYKSKEYESYIMLLFLSEILCLPLELKVSGSDSETNFYQPIVDLFPPTTHLSCDMHMKDSVQKKLSYVNFDITEIDEVMCYVFGKRHRYYVPSFFVDSDSVEGFEKMVNEGEGLLNSTKIDSLK